MIDKCKKCGEPLFETLPFSNRKIFGSFATKFDKDNNEEYYLCYNWYINKDVVKEERKEENGED